MFQGIQGLMVGVEGETISTPKHSRDSRNPNLRDQGEGFSVDLPPPPARAPPGGPPLPAPAPDGPLSKGSVGRKQKAFCFVFFFPPTDVPGFSEISWLRAPPPPAPGPRNRLAGLRPPPSPSPQAPQACRMSWGPPAAADEAPSQNSWPLYAPELTAIGAIGDQNSQVRGRERAGRPSSTMTDGPGGW